MANNEPILNVCTKITPVKCQNLEWKLENFDLFVNTQINLITQQFGPFFNNSTTLILSLHNDVKNDQQEAKITLSVDIKGSALKKMNICGQIWFEHTNSWNWNFFIPIEEAGSTTFTFPTNLLESNSLLIIRMQYVSRQFHHYSTCGSGSKALLINTPNPSINPPINSSMTTQQTAAKVKHKWQQIDPLPIQSTIQSIVQSTNEVAIKKTKNASTDTIKRTKSKFQQTDNKLSQFNKEDLESLLDDYLKDSSKKETILQFVEKIILTKQAEVLFQDIPSTPKKAQEQSMIVVYDVTIEEKKQKEANGNSLNEKKPDSVICKKSIDESPAIQRSKPIQPIKPINPIKPRKVSPILTCSEVVSTSKVLKVNPTTNAKASPIKAILLHDPLAEAINNDGIEFKKTLDQFMQQSRKRSSELQVEDLYPTSFSTLVDDLKLEDITAVSPIEVEAADLAILLSTFYLKHKELCEYLKQVAIEHLRSGQKWEVFEEKELELQNFMSHLKLTEEAYTFLVLKTRGTEDVRCQEEIMDARQLFHRCYSGFKNLKLSFYTEICGHVSILKHLQCYEDILEQMHFTVYKIPCNRYERPMSLTVNLPILKERFNELKKLASSLYASPNLPIQKFNDDFAELEGYIQGDGTRRDLDSRKQHLLHQIEKAKVQISAESEHRKRKVESNPNEAIQLVDAEYKQLQRKVHEISTYLCMGNSDPVKLAGFEKDIRLCCQGMDIALQPRSLIGHNVDELQHYANYRSNLRQINESLNYKLMPWRIFLNHLSCIPSAQASCDELLEEIKTTAGKSKGDDKEVIRTLEDIDLTLKETRERISNARLSVSYLTTHARRHILLLEDEQRKLESTCSQMLSQLRFQTQCYPSSGPWISASYLSTAKIESIQPLIQDSNRQFQPRQRQNYIVGPMLL